MESEGKLFKTGIKILENMETGDFRKIKSGMGLVELSCTIVEESYNRLNMVSEKTKSAPWKIKGKDKKETAVLLLTPLLRRLEDKEIINEPVKNMLIDFMSRESIEDTVDDIVDTWKENLEIYHYKCLKLIKLFTTKKENTTRLSKINI